MKKRALGKTGLTVSEIAFGGVEIGLPYGIGVKSAADMLSETEAIRLLHAAVDAGINFFDTARLYGASESIMGKAFRDRRERVVLGTKCRHFKNPDGSIPAGDDLRTIVETSLAESLAALQTDYVDLYMLHQADLAILQNDDVAAIFSGLKQSGKVRAIGVSTYTTDETRVSLEAGIWEIIQLPFNLMDQRQATLFPLAEQRGVGIVVRSVLLKGLLSDRGIHLHPALSAVESHLKRYAELLDQTSTELATLATRFALSYPEVSSILVGIDRMEYLDKSLAAANGNLLPTETLLRARELAYPDPAFLNLPHWDKMGWLT